MRAYTAGEVASLQVGAFKQGFASASECSLDCIKKARSALQGVLRSQTLDADLRVDVGNALLDINHYLQRVKDTT